MEYIPESVITETKNVINNYLENASYEEIFNFRRNPIGTLKRIGVTLVNRISPRRLSRLSLYIKNIIDKVKDAVKEWRNCAACKIALKLIFFAFATAINSALAQIVGHFDFAQLLVEFFNKEYNQIVSFLTELGISIGEYNFFEINDLIERLCSKFGPCS